jgi:two-component system response regulator HydG
MPPRLFQQEEGTSPAFLSAGRLLSQERQLIMQTLKQVDWNKYRAAKMLGIARSTLYSKMKKLGIVPPAKAE